MLRTYAMAARWGGRSAMSCGCSVSSSSSSSSTSLMRGAGYNSRATGRNVSSRPPLKAVGRGGHSPITEPSYLQAQQRRAATNTATIQDAQQQAPSSLPLKSVRAWRRAHETQAKKNRRVGFAFPRLRSAETAMPLLVTEAEDSMLPPSWETLRLVALQRAVPFIGFGFMDNAIMILAGDYIETSIGFTLGISTMAAAALGVLIADVLGLGVGGLIEELSVRMGVPEPRLTKSQTEMWITRLTAMGGSSLGIALGCLLGMLPLAFLDMKKGDREESPADIFTVLAKEAQDMLQAERVVIITVEHGTRNMAQHYYASDGADKALPPAFLRDVILRTIARDEAVMFTYADEPAPGGIRSAMSWPVFDREGKIVAVVAAINKKQQEGGVGFDRMDVQAMVGMCSKAGEAMENLYRRPEEHNSFAQNMDALQMHLSVPLHRVHGNHVTSEMYHHQLQQQHQSNHHHQQKQPGAGGAGFVHNTSHYSPPLLLRLGR